MKKLNGLGAALAIPATAAALVSVALFQPTVAAAEPANVNALNVVGEPYAKALVILKSQGVKGYFGGSSGSDLPQSACIVAQQKITSKGRMYLNLDCTQAAADHATDSLPARPVPAAPSGAPGAPAAPAPGGGQGTYGGPIGVPVPVG